MSFILCIFLCVFSIHFALIAWAVEFLTTCETKSHWSKGVTTINFSRACVKIDFISIILEIFKEKQYDAKLTEPIPVYSVHLHKSWNKRSQSQFFYRILCLVYAQFWLLQCQVCSMICHALRNYLGLYCSLDLRKKWRSYRGI